MAKEIEELNNIVESQRAQIRTLEEKLNLRENGFLEYENSNQDHSSFLNTPLVSD
jgi:uncharacterized coiled-coil protein SlyX